MRRCILIAIIVAILMNTMSTITITARVITVFIRIAIGCTIIVIVIIKGGHIFLNKLTHFDHQQKV